MKRIITFFALIFCTVLMNAQNVLNNSGDNILGEYYSKYKGEESKMSFTKNADGTYNCRTIWSKNSIDPATGKKKVDSKNPDKSRRNVPCDQILIIEGLKYNADKKQWDGAKIYDPLRGIRANVTIMFTKEGRLSLRGSVMGIGETVFWDKL